MGTIMLYKLNKHLIPNDRDRVSIIIVWVGITYSLRECANDQRALWTRPARNVILYRLQNFHSRHDSIIILKRNNIWQRNYYYYYYTKLHVLDDLSNFNTYTVTILLLFWQSTIDGRSYCVFTHITSWCRRFSKYKILLRVVAKRTFKPPPLPPKKIGLPLSHTSVLSDFCTYIFKNKYYYYYLIIIIIFAPL